MKLLKTLNIPEAVLIPSATGLVHFLTSQGKSKTERIDLEVSGNFMIITIEKSTKRETLTYKGYPGNIQGPKAGKKTWNNEVRCQITVHSFRECYPSCARLSCPQRCKLHMSKEGLFCSGNRHLTQSQGESPALWVLWPLGSTRSYRKYYSLQQKAGFCRQLNALQLIVLGSDVKGLVPEWWYMAGMKRLGASPSPSIWGYQRHSRTWTDNIHSHLQKQEFQCFQIFLSPR